MDTLPLVLSAACTAVQRVRVRRQVDTSRRRFNLQRKTGAGMTPQEFAAELATGRMGHVGLAESAALLAHGLAFDLAAVEEEIAPVLATRPVPSESVTVKPGQVAGLHQIARALANGTAVVELDLTMALGGVADLDEIVIEGTPPLALRIPGGLPGDIATVAALLNTVPRVLGAQGLCTVLDLPLPRASR
jgi:4-hydroxy-tetrahydrodipicolinate reductase